MNGLHRLTMSTTLAAKVGIVNSLAAAALPDTGLRCQCAFPSALLLHSFNWPVHPAENKLRSDTVCDLK